MNILNIHTYNYPRGGDYTHLALTNELFISKGHKVINFCMTHPNNLPSEFENYFVPYIDFVEELKRGNSIFAALKVVFRTIYSVEAKKRMETLLSDFNIDLVMINGFLHHLTPSIFGPIKKRGIPIVVTLHDYTAICPNTSFLDSNGAICEACKPNRFYKAFVRKCKKNSRGASLVAGLENTMHRLMGVWQQVDHFITPSQFMRNKFIEFGFDSRKITCIPNFVRPEVAPEYTNQGYALYFGRLSKEKGLENLVEVFKGFPNRVLKIVGTGPMSASLLNMVNDNKITNVQLMGYKSGQDLIDLIKGAAYTITPSIWYENFPYSVLESMLYGKPVIVAGIGGMPEQVENGVNGVIYQFDDRKALKAAIQQMENTDWVTMGQHARESVIRKFNAAQYYSKLSGLLNNLKVKI